MARDIPMMRATSRIAIPVHERLRPQRSLGLVHLRTHPAHFQMSRNDAMTLHVDSPGSLHSQKFHPFTTIR
jgi:hypothetical protein